MQRAVLAQRLKRHIVHCIHLGPELGSPTVVVFAFDLGQELRSPTVVVLGQTMELNTP